jgi:large subunit ribosomal protein L5
MAVSAPPARLKLRYQDEIRPELIERFGYSSAMQVPKLQKITINMGVGDAKQDSKALQAAQEQLATIAGQQPSVRRSRKSIAAFKLREGMPVGLSVTLRGQRLYEFLDRLTSVAIPRIRDFRGLSPKSFDGRGNYSMGVREQIIFPEIDYDAIDQIRGMDITITTTAQTDVEAFVLLKSLGMPFSNYGRPADFRAIEGEEQAEKSDGDEKPTATSPAVPTVTDQDSAEATSEESAQDPDDGDSAEPAASRDSTEASSESTDAAAEDSTDAAAEDSTDAAAEDSTDAAAEDSTDAAAEDSTDTTIEESSD